MNDSHIALYESADGKIKFEVTLKEDSVWLNRQQLVVLFDRDIKTIGKHISNARNEELKDLSVVAKFATTGSDGKVYQVEHYNLDLIISIGYRVKSSRGVQFRRWASTILKEYLIKGYAIKQNATETQLAQVRRTIEMISRINNREELSIDETKGLIKVLEDFSYGLDILDRYDYRQLTLHSTSIGECYRLTYEDCLYVIDSMSEFSKKSTLFGREKDQSFQSSIQTIYQTFDNNPLYPSIEEKAAMLLYLVVKNHSFVDGNKRIAAALFLWFLERNRILYKRDNTKLIENNTLVALTLMIAESKSEEMEVMVKVIVSLINQKN